MKILTIINSIVLILILIKLKIIPIKFQQHTSTNNKIVGYSCLIKNFYFYIPLRNREKINLKENIKYLKTLDYQQKKQHLSAIFSWFKSNEEVDKLLF